MIKATAVIITRDKEIHPLLKESLKDFDEVLIHTESPSVYERYLTASKARNEVIYVQDDDCIIDYQELWTHHKSQLTNTMTDHHQHFYAPTGMTLVGWGCFFPKSALKVFDKYIEKYGVDDVLLRDADRIFTYLNQPFTTIIRDHKDIIQQENGRMWRDPKHWDYMWTALERAKSIKMV